MVTINKKSSDIIKAVLKNSLLNSLSSEHDEAEYFRKLGLKNIKIAAHCMSDAHWMFFVGSSRGVAIIERDWINDSGWKLSEFSERKIQPGSVRWIGEVIEQYYSVQELEGPLDLID